MRAIAVIALLFLAASIQAADVRTSALEAPSWLLAQSKQLQSCRACSASRDRCHTGCDSHKTNSEKLKCVNACNAQYPCVMGSDCR
jgi:hypothetical protein